MVILGCLSTKSIFYTPISTGFYQFLLAIKHLSFELQFSTLFDLVAKGFLIDILLPLFLFHPSFSIVMFLKVKMATDWQTFFTESPMLQITTL